MAEEALRTDTIPEGTGLGYAQWGNSYDPEVVGLALSKRPPTCPEETLMLAVLQSAVDDIDSGQERKQADALWYIHAHDQDHAFSFAHLCEHFSLDPDAVKRSLYRRVGSVSAVLRRFPMCVEDMKVAIKDALKDTNKPVRISAIQLSVGGASDYVQEVVNKMVTDGDIRRVDFGWYILSHKMWRV